MKIASVEAVLADLPMSRPHRLAMATIHRHSMVLVRVRTDDGIEGLGEVAIIPHYGDEVPSAVKAVIDEVLAPHLVGEDAAAIGLLLARMDRLIKGNAYAKAAIEMACVDASAKQLGVPASRLFGGAVRERLPMMWVLGTGKVETDLAEAEARLDARTHRIFLVKIGNGDPAESVARAVSIKKALGDRASVRVDVNQAWDESTAAWGIARLEAGGIDVIEQPVARRNLGAMRRLAERFAVPIMADESVATMQDALAIVREGAADAFSLKLSKHGGMTRTREIAAVADGAGITLFGGTMIEAGLGAAASAHLFATLPTMSWGCQLFGPQLMTDDYSIPGIRYEEFELVVPPGPGFGVRIDEDKLRFYRRPA